MTAFMLILGLSAQASTPWTPKLDRVEVLSDDPGTWIHYELPMAHLRPSTAALRLIEQIQPIWNTPWEGVRIGTSLAVQTIQFEQPMGASNLGWGVGLQTKLLCPRGVIGSLYWNHDRIHLGFGLSVASQASWQHPDWRQWNALPTASVGISR